MERYMVGNWQDVPYGNLAGQAGCSRCVKGRRIARVKLGLYIAEVTGWAYGKV